jgi:glycosyltransferase involved in cell wall biosynthesis
LSIIGLSLKKTFPELDWIVDWQDLWSLDEYYLKRVPALYGNKIMKLENKVLTNCDVNVTTNKKAERLLIEHYNVPPERTVAVNHHFYRPDIPEDLRPPKNHHDFKAASKIKIGFLGNLFKPPKVPGAKVVEAIRNLRKLKLNIELHVFGDSSKTAQEAASNSADDSVVLHPQATHKKSLLNISKCQFLLLALSDLPNSRLVMHGKLPHYLLLKLPILAIVPQDSFVAQVIRETGSGYVIPTESVWEEQLENIIMSYSEPEYYSQRNQKEIEKYSWDNISKCWLRVIKDLSLH